MVYFFLSIAIIAELIATTALKASNGFTQWRPSLIVVTGYCISFFFLSLTLKVMPVSIAYAIWSGAGIVLISLFSYFYFHQSLDLPALVGITLIVIGVIIVNLFSRSVMPH